MQLTESHFPALAQAFAQIAAGKPIMIMPLDEELSTQQAADLLNVSRPYFLSLLEQQEIPCRTVGTWNRIKLSDVLAYKRKSEAQAQKALQELVDQAQELQKATHNLTTTHLGQFVDKVDLARLSNRANIMTHVLL